MATWHQQRNPVKLYHETKWTLVTNPPGDMCTLWLESDRETAHARLATWRENNRQHIEHTYILPPESWDTTPRYAPEQVMVVAGRGGKMVPVTEYRVHTAGNHPAKCPIGSTYTVVELVTEYGSRWYGFDRAYINSELKMVVVGFGKRDEIRSKWRVCETR